MSRSNQLGGKDTTRLTVSYTRRGTAHDVEVEVPKTGDPEEELKVEAAHYVQTLADNGQLDGPDGTHQIVTKPDGTKTLQRRRFTAT
jgi:hypothetical protein